MAKKSELLKELKTRISTNRKLKEREKRKASIRNPKQERFGFKTNIAEIKLTVAKKIRFQVITVYNSSLCLLYRPYQKG